MNLRLFVRLVGACAALLICSSSTVGQEVPVKCTQTADVIFVVDTSSSIWPPYFNINMKDFIMGIIRHFNVGPGPEDSRIGLVKFSTRVYKEFQLKDYPSIDAIEKHIRRRMRYRGGNTNTHKALDYVARTMLTKQNGMRDDVSKLVIIITDGESNRPALTAEAAEILKSKMDVDVFAIGVGPQAKKSELKTMASDPDHDFVFHVKDFNAISKIQHRFANQTCQALMAATTTTTTTTTTPTTTSTTTTTPTTTSTTTTTPTTTPTTTTTTTTTTPTTTSTTTTTPTTTSTTTTTTTTTNPTTTTTATPSTTTTTPTPTTTTTKTTTTPPPTTEERPLGDDADTGACTGRPADVYLLLDASSSLWRQHFHASVSPFVRRLVASFEMSPMATRVGLVVYARDEDQASGLASHRNLRSLQTIVQPSNTAHLAGGSDASDAISFVTTHRLGNGHARRGVAQILITVSDETSRHSATATTEQAAKAARDQGMFLFSVGVGKDLERGELATMATKPTKDFIFTVDSFTGLPSVADSLAGKTCAVVARSKYPKDSSHGKFECTDKPLNVLFMYEYMNSVRNSKATLDGLVSQFTSHAALYAPQAKVGVMTQPCITDEISLMSAGEFQHALSESRSNYFVTMADLIRKARVESFSKTPISSERRIAVLVLDPNTMNSDALRKEARRLKLKGVQVMVVAVGEVDERLLEVVVSYPMVDNVLRVSAYGDLENTGIRLLDSICKNHVGLFEFAQAARRRLPTTELVFNGRPQ